VTIVADRHAAHLKQHDLVCSSKKKQRHSISKFSSVCFLPLKTIHPIHIPLGKEPDLNWYFVGISRCVLPELGENKTWVSHLVQLSNL